MLDSHGQSLEEVGHLMNVASCRTQSPTHTHKKSDEEGAIEPRVIIIINIIIINTTKLNTTEKYY